MSAPMPPPARPDTRTALVNAVWDLRDLAYDNPEDWSRITAENFFQSLGEVLEDLDDAPNRSGVASWAEITLAVRTAAQQAVARARPAPPA